MGNEFPDKSQAQTRKKKGVIGLKKPITTLHIK
jgi:hypothetical protein